MFLLWWQISYSYFKLVFAWISMTSNISIIMLLGHNIFILSFSLVPSFFFISQRYYLWNDSRLLYEVIDCPLIYHTLATSLPNLYPVTKYIHAKKKECVSFMQKFCFWPLTAYIVLFAFYIYLTVYLKVKWNWSENIQRIIDKVHNRWNINF